MDMRVAGISVSGTGILHRECAFFPTASFKLILDIVI